MATINFTSGGSELVVPVLTNKQLIANEHLPPRQWIAKSAVAGTWYVNTSGYETVVYVQSTTTTNNNTIWVSVRKDSNSAAMVFDGGFNMHSSNKSYTLMTLVPAGWEYQLGLGANQVVSKFYEYAVRP